MASTKKLHSMTKAQLIDKIEEQIDCQKHIKLCGHCSYKIGMHLYNAQSTSRGKAVNTKDIGKMIWY